MAKFKQSAIDFDIPPAEAVYVPMLLSLVTGLPLLVVISTAIRVPIAVHQGIHSPCPGRRPLSAPLAVHDIPFILLLDVVSVG